MKQYVYKPQDIGRSRWSPGELRLEGIEITANPKEADLFVCPGALHDFKVAGELNQFPYMKGNEAKHVFFHCSDDEVLYSKACLFIRCNTRDWYFATDPQTISWPWPVDDFVECVKPPRDGFKYDISFQGWLSSDVRVKAVESCRSHPKLSFDIATYGDFTGYLKPDNPEYHRRRSEFRRSMKESRVALCPESIAGVFPYRFFEAMSAGRIPLLVGSHFVLPFADEIPYTEFALFCATDGAIAAGSVASEFIRQTPDAEIIEKGKFARQYWEKYLQRDLWPRLMSYAVIKKLKCVSP